MKKLLGFRVFGSPGQWACVVGLENSPTARKRAAKKMRTLRKQGHVVTGILAETGTANQRNLVVYWNREESMET